MANDPKSKTKKAPGVRIASAIEGFRRAGRAWSKEAQDFSADTFTKDQLAQLRAEPNLVVVDIEIDVPAE